jgi:mono/diheme cytochrome c family protein
MQSRAISLHHWILVALLLAVVGLSAAASAAPAAPSGPTAGRGKAIYEQRCAVCHGVDGRADTPVGQLLKPRPRNFADPVEMARVSQDRMYHSIKEGRPGTGMAAWKDVLSETEIGDVMDYIHAFATMASAAAPLPADRLSLEVGRRIFERECASCHGKDGAANTDVARVLDPPPRVFADPITMARLDDGRMFSAIYRGRPGTAMGGRGELLSPSEIIDVMRYIRTLARPLPDGMTPARLDTVVGEQIYKQNCAGCHGDKGDGQTTIGRQIMPHPRNFTDPDEMANLGDKEIAQAISRGVAGSSMAPWEGVLNKEDIRRVTVYIRQTLAHH